AHTLDVLGGERADFLAIEADRTDKLGLLGHRDDEKRASTAEVGKGDKHWIAVEVKLPGPDVLDVGDLSCPFHVTQTTFRMGAERPGPRLNVCRRCIVERNSAETVAVVQIEHAELCPANARRKGQNGVEDRLQVARRAGDHAQYVGGGRLLLQRLGEFLFQLGGGRAVNVSSRLRSGRTQLAAARWAIGAFERQVSLVGTATGPPSGRPSQESSLSILTEPHDELAPFMPIGPGAAIRRSGFMERAAAGQTYSGLMFAARTTWPHFSVYWTM